jgi:hypothetical protein
VVTFVELVVWPERTGPRLRAALARALRIASTLAPVGPHAAAPQLRRTEIDVLTELRHAAGLAEEARLEGAKTGVDPATALDSLETLRRFVYRLMGLGLLPRRALSPEVDRLRNRVATALDGRILALAERIAPSAPRAASPVDGELETFVGLLTERLSAVGERTEAESYGRAVGLLHDLEQMLAPLART